MIYIKALYAFVVFLEILIVAYIIFYWLFRNSKLTKALVSFLNPVIGTMKYLLKKSSIYTSLIDFSPIITLILLAYIEKMLYYIMY